MWIRNQFDRTLARSRGWAQACRWGIVLVAMVLVPGVAFLGHGIGSWLRTQSTSRWTPQAVRINPGQSTQPQHETVVAALTEKTPETRPRPEESAALYNGAAANAAETALAAFDQAAESAEQDLVHAAYGETTPNGENAIRTGAFFADDHAGQDVTSLGSSERFAEFEQRLRSLGAISYALEADRRSGFSYRFVCVMPSAAGKGAEERFQASGRSPLEAIQQVVQQIESAVSMRP